MGISLTVKIAAGGLRENAATHQNQNSVQISTLHTVMKSQTTQTPARVSSVDAETKAFLGVKGTRWRSTAQPGDAHQGGIAN